MALPQRAFTTGCILLPVFAVLLWPSWSQKEFSPRKVIYSKDTLSVFLAPWTTNASISGAISRLLQAGIAWNMPPMAVGYAYMLWIVIAVIRTLTGFVLTRAVGWAYPSLFQHYALYETSSGLGPPLIALLIVNGWELESKLSGVNEAFVFAFIASALAWLDRSPWTYATAVLLVIPMLVLRRMFPTSNSAIPASRRQIDVRSIFLSLVAIVLPYIIITMLPFTIIPKPGPSLEILVLSYPRPNDTPSSSILSTTIGSFSLHLPQVTLSVFTHSSPDAHPSFLWAKENTPNVEFYVDLDTHSDAIWGQHLHIAEAFRWLEGKEKKAEWIMVIEDDFPLCGSWGQRSLARVMERLEQGRHPDYLERRGAFVGTGGSGLIFHKTLLPILQTLLLLHASTNTALPVDVIHRPADLIMQDCILGVDPLCPRRNEVISLHSNATSPPVMDLNGGGNLVITSRMIIDHIGGSSSTAQGRTYGSDQWRCGWRHPFHGMDEVDVVVV